MKLKRIKVSDLGTIITGNTPPRKDPDNYGSAYPFIKPTDIEIDTRFTFSPEECYSKKAYDKYKKSLIPKDATCVVTIGSIGKKITMAHTDCFINQAMNAVVPNEYFDEYYVFYLLKQNLYKVKALDSGTSSGRENVSKSAFSGIEVDVHENKLVQRRIGSILSAYDDLIENNLRRIQLLEEAARCQYKLLMAECETSDRPFSSIAIYINGFAFKPHHWQTEGKPIVKIKELKEGINKDTPRYHGRDIDEKYKIKSGDILFSWSASLDAFLWAEGDALLNQHIFKVVPNDTNKYCFTMLALKEEMGKFRTLSQGATMQHIKRSALDQVTTRVPSEDDLEELEQKTRPYFESIINLTRQNLLLRQARDILLPLLMSGEIDVASEAVDAFLTKSFETACI